MTSVGFIGAGNMGAALIRGWSGEQGLRLQAYDPDQTRLEALARDTGLHILDSPLQVVRNSDYVLLAVKPDLTCEILRDTASAFGPGQVLISIAAGVKLRLLQEAIEEACAVVRVMPNTPALAGAGVFAICAEDPALASDKKDLLLQLFAKLGRVHQIPEKNMDAFTALIGSGPAYVFYFLQSLIQAGVTQGLPREQALDMVLGLVQGSVRMAEESQEPLGVLLEQVCSPAGTTIEGVNHLERRAVRAAIMDAVHAACERSRQL